MYVTLSLSTYIWAMPNRLVGEFGKNFRSGSIGKEEFVCIADRDGI